MMVICICKIFWEHNACFVVDLLAILPTEFCIMVN